MRARRRTLTRTSSRSASCCMRWSPGRRAFTGKTHASLISSILKDAPRSIIELQPLVPPLLDHIVSRCLAKDPDDRWQSASDLTRELRWISESSAAARVAAAAGRHVSRPGTLPRVGRSCRSANGRWRCRRARTSHRASHPTASGSSSGQQGDRRNVWVHDLARGRTPSRLTSEARNARAIWTPDGTRVTYGSAAGGNENIFWKPADGSGPAERLTTSDYMHFSADWSPDRQNAGVHRRAPRDRPRDGRELFHTTTRTTGGQATFTGIDGRDRRVAADVHGQRAARALSRQDLRCVGGNSRLRRDGRRPAVPDGPAEGASPGSARQR